MYLAYLVAVCLIGLLLYSLTTAAKSGDAPSMPRDAKKYARTQRTSWTLDHWLKHPIASVLASAHYRGNFMHAHAALGNITDVERYLNDVTHNQRDKDAVLAAVNRANEWGSRPLHWACAGGDVELVRFLLERGADPKLGDDVGATAVHWACINDNAGVIRYFVDDMGFDVQATDGSGNTLLHYASGTGSAETAKALLDRGASISQKDEVGNIPLHEAAKNFLFHHNPDIFSVLVFEGGRAQFDARNEEGKTPIEMAAARGAAEAVRLLTSLSIASGMT